jgi:hypothetical protein
VSDGVLVRWVTEPARYPGDVEGAVPVLLPAADRKAEHWRRVVSEQYGATLPPAPGARVVLALGADGRSAASVYARRSGSRLVGCADVAEVLAAMAQAAEEHVVIVAAAELLTVAVLARVSAGCRAAGKDFGVLTGRGVAELSFAVAKALLRPRPELSGVDLFDAPLHRDEENRARLAPDFARRLTRHALAKVLRSHGEGGHGKLPGTVVCGLLDQVEFREAPDAGCVREPRRCKRAGAVQSTVVFADELPAPVVAFVCCNGFNVAGELYPSPVSMALSFTEGWAGALLAPIRPLIAPDDMVTVLCDGLAAGVPLGRITVRLNELSERVGQRDAFVLHGDPCLALPPVSAPAPAAAGDDRAGRDRAENEKDCGELLDWLVLTLQQAERGRRLLRSATSWLGERATPLLDPLRARFEQVERLALNAVKWAEMHPVGASRQRLDRLRLLLKMGVVDWDRTLSRLLLEIRDTVDAYDLGHYDQVLAEIRTGARCPRCGAPTEVHVYGRGEDPGDRRLAEACWVCGPVAECREAGLAVRMLDSPPTGTGGGWVELTARLRVPDEPARVVDVVQLYLRFYDKANGVCVHEQAEAVTAENQDVRYRFRLPDQLGVDLHSVRLIAASGFDVAYTRARLAGLPAPRSGRAGGGSGPITGG